MDEMGFDFEAVRKAFNDFESKAKAFNRAKERLIGLLHASNGNAPTPTPGDSNGNVKPGSLAGRVYEIIKNATEPIPNKTLIETLGAKSNSLRGTLWNLKNRGLIERADRGWWRLPKGTDKTTGTGGKG